MAKRLISHGSGHYETGDGRGLVVLDDTFQTECDEPHPVRMRRDSISRYSDWYQRELLARNRSRNPNWITFQCEGNEQHYYSQWAVQVDGEWTHDVYDSFAQARQVLEETLGYKLTLQRQQNNPRERRT
jgi:hypothetical protein